MSETFAKLFVIGLLGIASLQNLKLNSENVDLAKENQHLKDQLELIQTIKNEQCDLLPEPPKNGE